MSNQIENSWNKDSCLALRKDEKGFVVKIRTDAKKILKKRFIVESKDKSKRKNNRKVIVIIYCYMLYKLIKISNGLGRKIRICNDAGPPWAINKYMNSLLKYFNELPLGQNLQIRFRKPGDKDSSAHGIARKSMRGSRKEDYLITNDEIEIIKDIIIKIL